MNMIWKTALFGDLSEMIFRSQYTLRIIGELPNNYPIHPQKQVDFCA